MEKFIVAVFENETKAYEGVKALKRLDANSSLEVHQAVVLEKQSDGSVTVPESALADFPVRTIQGTALGGLLGLLAGPVGVTVGMSLGALAGLWSDAVGAAIDEDFLKEVSASLKPGSAALVIDASEEWITPLDTEFEPLSATIIRRSRIDVEDEIATKRIAATRAEIDSLEQELTQAHQDRKAKLQSRIESLKKRVDAQVAKLEKRTNELHTESKAKIDAMEAKVSKSAAETKSKLQARIDAMREADLNFQAKVQNSIASGLRKVADQFQSKRA